MIRLRFLALLIVTSLLDVVSLSQINNPDNSVNLLSSWILADNSASSTLMPTSDLRKSEAANIESLGTLEALTTDLDNQNNCQLTQVIHILKHAGCHPKEIQSYACSGSCPSYVQLSTSKLWNHERSCSCCQQTGLQKETFVLDCPSLKSSYRQITVYAPIGCLCRSCDDSLRNGLKPQEFIEALADRNN